MADVTWSKRATVDLQQAWTWLDHVNPAAAERLVSEIEKRVDLLRTFPEIGSPRDDIARGARGLYVHPYWILYRCLTANDVQIVRLYHAKQDPRRIRT